MPHMPRLRPTNTTKPKARRPIAVMSVSKKTPVEARAPGETNRQSLLKTAHLRSLENDEASTSLGASSWAEDPLAGVEQIPTRQKRGPTCLSFEYLLTLV
jgi:hypothetical protein